MDTQTRGVKNMPMSIDYAIAMINADQERENKTKKTHTQTPWVYDFGKVSGSTIYAIEYYPIDHAVVCYQDVCVDNGTISDGWFDRVDLAHYNVIGTVITTEE